MKRSWGCQKVQISKLVVPPGLEPHVYIIDNQLFIKTNGTFWVPKESVSAFTLTQIKKSNKVVPDVVPKGCF